MRILVTGGTGAVGSHVVRNLVKRGDEVAILARDGSDTWRIHDVLGQVHVVKGQLEHPASYRDGLREFRAETVVHLAWSGVLGKHRNDCEQAYINIPGTLALLSQAEEAGVRTFVGLGSQAEYGAVQDVITEGIPAEPTTLYGAAKLAAYTVCKTFSGIHQMRFAWLRLFSSYGPADNPEWMIPYLILELLQGRRPSLTAGEQMWDYLYQADAAEAVVTVAHDAHASGLFNLGAGEARSLRSIVEYIRDLIDPTLPLGWGEVPYRPDQVMHLQADISRLMALGWQPAISLEQGLTKTVEWFRDNQQRYGVGR